MDECVRLEEALQAEESRKAEVEQSPRPRPVRRRSRWPFSLDDFAKTDEYRLPPLSTELAAFSPGPAEASPRRRGTNPSSSPHISQRNDNLQSRNDPSQSAARGSKGQVETAVEQLPSRTETRTRQERKASYAMRSTSKHRDKQREATARSPTFPRTTTSTDLGRLQDNKNPHRYSPPIAVQSETNTQENQDRERLTRVENAAAAGSRAPRVVSEPEPMQIAEIVDILHNQEATGPVKKDSRVFANTRIEFTAVCKACVPVEFNADAPQHGALMMLEISTVFPEIANLTTYRVETKFTRTTDSTVPGPKLVYRAEYPLNKGDPEKGGRKRPNMVTRSGAGDASFILELNNFKSSEIVIYVALLLEQDQGKTTESFQAGVGLHVASADQERNPISRMLGSGGDVKLSIEPKDLGRHCKRLVLNDLNLHELLRSWVVSE